MPDTPYPINATDPRQAVNQMKQLIDELFQERIAGMIIGDVFQAGEDDVLTLRLLSIGGLHKVSGQLAIKPKTSGAVDTDADGLYVLRKANYGIDADADGLKLKQQAHEADAAAVSDLVVAGGADHIGLAAFNAQLVTLIAEINAIKTSFNNLLAKLRTGEFLAPVP